MNIIVCNNPFKRIYSENYDQVIYLGYIPEKDLEKNEVIINNNNKLLLNGWLISKYGIISSNKISLSKIDLQSNYKKSVNQIVLNNRDTNFSFITPTEEKIEFVALNGHLELII